MAASTKFERGTNGVDGVKRPDCGDDSVDDIWQTGRGGGDYPGAVDIARN